MKISPHPKIEPRLTLMSGKLQGANKYGFCFTGREREFKTKVGIP
jgi:hypothetical protein